ncbi:unnamed protein product [Leptosia nina]|uniref:Uncharacterized protein n=1 Tax=Leptosia nina TaxID=320188 RepID=A0AAV1J5G7_9NEOP
MCTGCTRCSCTKDGTWSCKDVIECPEDDDEPSGNTIDEAVEVLFSEVKEREKKKIEEKKRRHLAPPPPNSEFDSLIVPDDFPYEENFEKFMERNERVKRSVEKSIVNETIKYHNIVDEINEDTLMNSNKSGTIEAQKVDALKPFRRQNVNEIEKSELSSLHIDYNQRQDFDRHIVDNKIDSTSHSGDDSLPLSEKKINKIVGNYSQTSKDRTLSKIVVNELKKGKEIIGAKNITPMSNITFTVENDTLTAMTFIAGNLLNKLWNMEKDSSESFENDSVKHQKINDLLELFKEPLSLRQETFLKNALQKLSSSMNENKNINNISICETLRPLDSREKKSDISTTGKKCNVTMSKKSNASMTNNVSSEVSKKLNEVLNLIKKFEDAKKSLNELKGSLDFSAFNKSVEERNISENNFNLFAKILEKITRLLLPRKRSNKMIEKLKSLQQFSNIHKIDKKLKGTNANGIDSLPILIKDKIILDYVNHIRGNPNCLLRKIAQESDVSTIDIKGNILDSLSELIKIGSFADLSKEFNKGKEIPTTTTPTTTSTTIQPSTLGTFKHLRMSKERDSSKLASAKERLKSHIQSIINDLAELQNERGSNGPKINLTDILPCISHFIEKDENQETIVKEQPLYKEKHFSINDRQKLVDALQFEFDSNILTRRSNAGEDSTSARVWQRIISNINDMTNLRTRRFDSKKPKSIEELKIIIESIEELSNSYKNYALLSVIRPHKKLMLLKTLRADVLRHKNALDYIKKSKVYFENTPPENLKEILEFIGNTATNIKLSNNVLNSLNVSKEGKENEHQGILSEKRHNNHGRGAMNYEKLNKAILPFKANHNFKLTRQQIMNQLMLNRLRLYLKIKEDEGVDKDDVNYNIGKRAFNSLHSGNGSLARELYKILIDNKSLSNGRQSSKLVQRKGVQKQNTQGAILYALKEPLISVDPNNILQSLRQDLVFTK